MTTHQPINHGVDVAATPSRVSYISLILGILSVPGSILTWDTPARRGLRLGPAARAARRRCSASTPSATAHRSRWAAVTGIVLGGAMVADDRRLDALVGGD